MADLYVHCPTYESAGVRLRPLRADDAPALLRCYADPNAVPFFNADNCHGDTFYYPTEARMTQAVQMWLDSYAARYFVRFVVEDTQDGSVVGTVEMFHNDPTDRPNAYGVLRVDVASPYERADFLAELFALCGREFFAAFDVAEMVTKAVPEATERRKALTALGYRPAAFRVYEHYYALMQKG